MFVNEIRLRHFRNYEKIELQLSPGIYVLQGANGQGKSNLLEAIYHLCFGRSFRNFKESDLVSWNYPFYFIQGFIQLKNSRNKVEIGYETAKKRKVIKINGKREKNYSLAGQCPVVFFVPEDLELIRRGPEERRRFLDREISQLFPLYGEYLNRYNRVIYQKNQTLKEKRSKEELKKLVQSWNKQIIYFGSRIIMKRAHMVSIWSNLAARNFNVLFENGEEMKIVYENFLGEELFLKDIEEIEADLQTELSKKEEEEFKRGYSLVGPHRDDLIFLHGGREARRFSSHGQQRSAILALKAAQIQFYNTKKEKPLFILDDIFSELDEKRRQQCFSLFDGAEQVFLTITQKGDFLDPLLKKFSGVAFLHVKEGTITELKNNGKSGTIY